MFLIPIEQTYPTIIIVNARNTEFTILKLFNVIKRVFSFKLASAFQ
jgi:hypothetical protein